MKPRILFAGICLIASVSKAHAFDVIAHRGASGYLPEHTLEAATLAHAQSPTFIEQDIVLSKDLVPIVLHDIHLETVTDVEQKYPGRAREDGRFYALDFTLKELRTLNVHERTDKQGNPVFPSRYQGDASFHVATLKEHIELISQLNRLTGQNIGFYPEFKSPAWHREQGIDISSIVIELLRQYGLDSPDAPIYVQCFDHEELRRIRHELGAKMKLVQLMAENSWAESPTDYDWLRTSEGLASVASVAQGVGPWIVQLVDMPKLAQGQVVPQLWLKEAQSLGLKVHPYTYRIDALPQGMSGTMLLDILVNKVKADGVFTDQVPPVKQFLNK